MHCTGEIFFFSSLPPGGGLGQTRELVQTNCIDVNNLLNGYSKPHGEQTGTDQSFHCLETVRFNDMFRVYCYLSSSAMIIIGPFPYNGNRPYCYLCPVSK